LGKGRYGERGRGSGVREKETGRREKERNGETLKGRKGEWRDTN
jgi:hypothetical protein